MKLLYCRACQDIQRLHHTAELRACQCGRSRGRYRNSRAVEVSGPCIVLGMPSLGFIKSLENAGPNFRGYRIAEPTPSIIRLDENSESA